MLQPAALDTKLNTAACAGPLTDSTAHAVSSPQQPDMEFTFPPPRRQSDDGFTFTPHPSSAPATNGTHTEHGAKDTASKHGVTFSAPEAEEPNRGGSAGTSGECQ